MFMLESGRADSATKVFPLLPRRPRSQLAPLPETPGCSFYGDPIPGHVLAERVASYVHVFNLYWCALCALHVGRAWVPGHCL